MCHFLTNPIDPFPILEPRNSSIDELYVIMKGQLTDFEAFKCERVGRVKKVKSLQKALDSFVFMLEGILGPWFEFPVSLSDHVGFTL